MKYLPFVMILFVSCQMAPDFTYSTKLPEGVNSLESAFLYASSMDYQTDVDGGYLQAPGETMDRGAGDCDDIALLFSALAEELGHDGKIGYTVGHFVSIVDGDCYDPTPILTSDGWAPVPFEIVEADIIRVYTVSEAIQTAIEEYGSY
jgi:hypothetical protein